MEKMSTKSIIGCALAYPAVTFFAGGFMLIFFLPERWRLLCVGVAFVMGVVGFCLMDKKECKLG